MNNLFLIYFDEQPACYAYREGMTENPQALGWWQVDLVLLHLGGPIRVKWGLNTAQLYEGESFTLGGKVVRFLHVQLGEDFQAAPAPPPEVTPLPLLQSKVVSLAGRKKRPPR